MHSNVTIKNVSWPHFSWLTLYTYIDISFAKADIHSSASLLPRLPLGRGRKGQGKEEEEVVVVNGKK